jgi:glycosyltransferase involved in cell wall biosynthesis
MSQTAAPFFSVVIPTYNRRSTLLACLAALERQTIEPGSFEVLVVVDGSTDDTAEAVGEREFRFAVRCLVVPNGGASKARNAGVAAARGEYIALTEDDVVPDDTWLANAADALRDGAIDVLEGRTVYDDTRRDVRRMDAGGIPSFIPCNLFVRRQVFLELGGYDPEFYDGERHLYFREDAEFGFRIVARGYRVMLAYDVVVAHPQQFSDLALCFRHVRRYVFDPLLYKKHPALFRQMIEVKKMSVVTVRRPQHIVAWVSFLSMLAALAAGLSGHFLASGAALAAFALCGQVFRWKYQGIAAFRLYDAGETLGFMVLPLVYFFSVVRGCVKYGEWGPIV